MLELFGLSVLVSFQIFCGVFPGLFNELLGTMLVRLVGVSFLVTFQVYRDSRGFHVAFPSEVSELVIFEVSVHSLFRTLWVSCT